MDLMSISPSHHSTSFRVFHTLSKPFHSSSFNPQICIPSRSQSSRTSPRCFLDATTTKPSKNLNSGSRNYKPIVKNKSSAPQTLAKTTRCAEADAMALLLGERIVFLGNSIDGFVADAIISQLLLLGTQDSTKDIRLFINSPGGSLRTTPETSAEEEPRKRKKMGSFFNRGFSCNKNTERSISALLPMRKGGAAAAVDEENESENGV